MPNAVSDIIWHKLNKILEYRPSFFQKEDIRPQICTELTPNFSLNLQNWPIFDQEKEINPGKSDHCHLTPLDPKAPKPYIFNYPPQTPSVIYFWNPWVQTYILLHSDHYLVRIVKWPETPAVRFLALQNFFDYIHLLTLYCKKNSTLHNDHFGRLFNS